MRSGAKTCGPYPGHRAGSRGASSGRCRHNAFPPRRPQTFHAAAFLVVPPALVCGAGRPVTHCDLDGYRYKQSPPACAAALTPVHLRSASSADGYNRGPKGGKFWRQGRCHVPGAGLEDGRARMEGLPSSTGGQEAVGQDGERRRHARGEVAGGACEMLQFWARWGTDTWWGVTGRRSAAGARDQRRQWWMASGRDQIRGPIG